MLLLAGIVVIGICHRAIGRGDPRRQGAKIFEIQNRRCAAPRTILAFNAASGPYPDRYLVEGSVRASELTDRIREQAVF
jgi:hypothetical protein